MVNLGWLGFGFLEASRNFPAFLTVIVGLECQLYPTRAHLGSRCHEGAFFCIFLLLETLVGFVFARFYFFCDPGGEGRC